MKSQVAQTSRGPVEYTLMGSGPVVLACYGTSQDCHSTHGLELITQAGFSLLAPPARDMAALLWRLEEAAHRLPKRLSLSWIV